MEEIPQVHVLNIWLKKRSIQHPMHRMRPRAVIDMEGQKKILP
jgi:hypothetical protein